MNGISLVGLSHDQVSVLWKWHLCRMYTRVLLLEHTSTLAACYIKNFILSQKLLALMQSKNVVKCEIRNIHCVESKMNLIESYIHMHAHMSPTYMHM